jgi:methylmalonyl-CoA/ethylmalonyl-CoA epimerase
MASALGSDVVTQVGIVVRDIEATRRNWADLLGVPEPPIIVTSGFEVAQTHYKGAPSDATAKLCFFNMGQVQIELIQPDGKPSAWQDFLDEHGESVQHIAVVTPSMKEALANLESAGIPLEMKGEYTGGRYAYVDSAPKLGVMLELLENDR